MKPDISEDQASERWFPTLEVASRIYDVPLATLRWWVQTGKLRPETGLCYIGKSAHLDVRIFEQSLLMRRGPRPRRELMRRASAPC
jgi:hypothetical protein